MKFIKSYKRVMPGDIYPTQFDVGDECPPELADMARANGLVDDDTKNTTKRSAKRRGPADH